MGLVSGEHSALNEGWAMHTVSYVSKVRPYCPKANEKRAHITGKQTKKQHEERENISVLTSVQPESHCCTD